MNLQNAGNALHLPKDFNTFFFTQYIYSLFSFLIGLRRKTRRKEKKEIQLAIIHNARIIYAPKLRVICARSTRILYAKAICTGTHSSRTVTAISY